MEEFDDIISFMDVVDVDEEIVDKRLKSIMERNSFTSQHLANAMKLLKYKFLLNVKESDECDNYSEFEFVGKLINNIETVNIEIICKIIDIILSLNPSSIVIKSEHLLQQLLSNICIHLENHSSDENNIAVLLFLKVCDSILEAVSRVGAKLSLPFLCVPLEKIISSQNEQLLKHFLTITVKRFFDGISGYNILDHIWTCVKQLENNKLISLKVLCILSNYFLPLPDKNGENIFKSNIIQQSAFWEVVFFGLISNDTSTRKLSIYLMKRAIDCLKIETKCIQILTPIVTLTWNPDKEIGLKKTWDNFFILIDSLEEKQSNIVLPSLQLFDSLQDIGQCWLRSAYNIGLQHDNLQVKKQCALYRLQTPILYDSDAIVLLEALNDMNIYDNKKECAILTQKLKQHMNDFTSFINIIRNISKVKWSPVPIYHLSSILGCVYNESIVESIGKEELANLFLELIKVQCNNVIIRKAFHRNLSYLIGNCGTTLDWKDILNLYVQLEDDLWRNEGSNPLILLIKDQLIITNKQEFFKNIIKSHLNVDFILLYLSGHETEVNLFIEFVNEMFDAIENVNLKPNTNEIDCLLKANFMTHLLRKIDGTHKNYLLLYSVLKKRNETILNYVLTLLNTHIEDVENVVLFVNNVKYITKINTEDRILNEIYRKSVELLKNGTDIYKNIYGIYILNFLSYSVIFDRQYKLNIIDVNALMGILINVKLKNNCIKEGCGRLRNIFYSKACEVVFVLLHKHCSGNKTDYTEIVKYIEQALDCGGYSCLKWILNVIDYILSDILNEASIIFDISNFLARTWNDIEALNTNKQYIECIECFVKIITNDSLLNEPLYNNIIITYCNKIVEYAAIKNIPLYFLVDAMRRKDILKYGHMVIIFTEVLLASAVPRKDQRITENVIVELSRKYDIENEGLCLYTNFHIKYKTLLVLSKVTDAETLETIASLIIKRIDEVFRNKQRYHRNSVLHLTLQVGLQHLLFIFLKHRSSYVENIAMWCIEFLGKIPHQVSIRLYLEWYIALYYYYKGELITDLISSRFKSKNVPIVSQFMMYYWLLTHKMRINSCKQSEFEFVINTFTENTMGPTYSVRMYAQYLSKRIVENIEKCSCKIDTSSYIQTVKVIDKTLSEAKKLKEKTFDKLLNDCLVHTFDIVEYLLPSTLYYGEFLYEEWNNEIVNEGFAVNVFEEMINAIKIDPHVAFDKEWMETHKDQKEIVDFKMNVTNAEGIDNVKDNEIGTIQKKYIPWKNMCDIDVIETKRTESNSDLIVVATLIDKLPNLGGMARTSEVFGVHTYVIDSVRHLQDKQFQGLSVSAERWVNVIEVRPGQPLKDYLTLKKTEGYTIVAAEQTSSSIPLQAFKFQKKTLLLLGHEKEGVPCDFLPFMDACVEIPQQGVVRSLNVHVTAAIFIWEYCRQIIL